MNFGDVMKTASINITFFSDLNLYRVHVSEWTGIRYKDTDFDIEALPINNINFFINDEIYDSIINEYDIIKHIKHGVMSYNFPEIECKIILRHNFRKLHKYQKQLSEMFK